MTGEGKGISHRSGKRAKKKHRNQRHPKKRRKEQNSEDVLQPDVVHHDSHVSANWEKLSKIMGYDPFSKKNDPLTVLGHENMASKKIKHKHVSGHREKTVAPVSKQSEEPAVVPNDSKCQELANGSSKSNQNGLEASAAQCVGLTYEPKLLTKAVAMDCEMVGTGPSGKDSMLARISIVNSYGQCVYDKYVLPKIKVTDYRTAVSGIRPKDLKNAEKFETVQQEVADIIKGKILVGHALKNDFKVLYFNHPRRWVRDTSTYKPFHQMCGTRYPSLKKLASVLLNTKIQTGEHNSVEDAQTAMKIYSQYKKEWEVHERRKKHKNEESKNN